MTYFLYVSCRAKHGMELKPRSDLFDVSVANNTDAVGSHRSPVWSVQSKSVFGAADILMGNPKSPSSRDDPARSKFLAFIEDLLPQSESVSFFARLETGREDEVQLSKMKRTKLSREHFREMFESERPLDQLELGVRYVLAGE